MAKRIDENGFWIIENNPLSKVGIYPYLGKQIDPNGSLGLEPDKIYNVLRPEEELSKEETISSFKLIPLIDEHEMIGGEFTPAEKKGVEGILGEKIRFEDGKITGDIKIFSEKMKNQIENGKKELSLGYRCKYEFKPGVWNLQPYEVIQKDIKGNHIALVEHGRMGSDVRVYDSKNGTETTTFDSLGELKQMFEKKENETSTEEKKAEDGDNPIIGLLSDKVDEETLNKVLEAVANMKADSKTEDEKEEESETKDEEMEVKKEEKLSEDKCGKDEEEEEKESAMDAMPAKIMKMISDRDNLVKEVTPFVGTFDSADMTSQKVAEYACKKIGLKVPSEQAQSAIKGYVFAQSKVNKKTFALDSAIHTYKQDKALETYLKG